MTMPRQNRLAALVVAALSFVLAVAAAQPVFAQTDESKPAIATDATSDAAPPAATPDQAKPDEAAPSQPTAEAAPAKAVATVLPPEVNETITHVVDTMEGAEKTLTAITSADTDLGRLRDEIDKVISKTTQTADSLRPRLADINKQLSKLGPVPEKGASPEAPSIATERARLDAEASQVGGAIKTLEVTWYRARQAIDKITDLRLQIFVRSLTERMSSPLFPSLWTNLVNSFPSVSWRLNYNAADWAASVLRQKENVGLLVGGCALLFLLLKAFVMRVTRMRRDPTAPLPSFFDRAATASWVAPMLALPGIATTLAMYAGFDYLGLLYYPTAAPAGVALLRAVLIFIGVSALLSAVFAPHRPEHRLVDLSDRAATRLCRLLQILSAIYAADLFFSAVVQILYFPLSISVVQSLVTSLAFTGVMAGILLTPFEPASQRLATPIARIQPRWLKVPLWIAAAAVLLACLTGYVALGRFMAQQIVMTGVVALIAALLFLALRAFTRESSTSSNAIGTVLEEQFGIDAPRRRQLAWLTESILTLLLALAAVPVFMLQWGFSGPDIRDWLKSALFGFEIGQFHISLVRILIGIGLFTALLFATRLIQRRLRDVVLTRMDSGISNSIDTAVGYAGTAIAAMVAISYAGFDITNLAIVAGALSVGIGFGLQSIVNNFVSGLILLIERPIKVGDWVVVGNEQGNVRRISVRSTEIETFDRASLIVPNSELITGRVLNWTHRSAVGRIVMKFSAGPNANPRHVLAILTDCARRHPDIMPEAKPVAVFEGYSSTATDYTLRVLLPDITRGLKVQSDLRIEVFEAMKRDNIEFEAKAGSTAAS